MQTTHDGISLIDRSHWRDWLELAKPRMNLLILGTTLVGYCLANRHISDWIGLPNVLIGTALCAAGAAMLNQRIEWRYDALMPRTASRPLPTGRIEPRDALIAGVLCGVAGALLLLIFVNALTAALATLTLTSYVLVYTPMKRRTTLNTILGAVPGAIPPVMGWTAATGSLGAAGWAVFAILFIWQIPHFLAIALLYRDEYSQGGFLMLPAVDPNLSATARQIVLYSVALIPVSLTPVLIGIEGNAYLPLALGLDVFFLAVAIRCAILRTRADARRLFFASIIYLPALLTVLLLDRI